MKQLIELLIQKHIAFTENEPMALHTTFKIGGPARLMVLPESAEEIAETVKACRAIGVRYMAIGNGSNLLVADEGIDACVILLGKGYDKVRLLDDTTVYAEAGAPLMKVCRFALEHSLTGLEFAYGIPGSCGGGAFMNAGAYGGELKDVLVRCDHIDKDGNAGYLEGEALELSYRHSAYYNNGCIVTGLYLKLEKGEQEEIRARMTELMNRRKDKQPLEFPSAGSTFKRPEGYFAGALIEGCGLKGATVGGAQVSEKHAGFVINRGGATCGDVLSLCEQVSNTVKKETGVTLEMEIRVTQ